MRRKSVRVILGVLSFTCLSLLATGKEKNSSLKKVSAVTKAIDPSEYRRVLETASKTVPLTYNEPVRKMINYYVSSHRDRFSRMLGLSQYYFPIYEKIFTAKGVPEEIKYLSVVESSLNPYATSTAQAGGLWQFLEPVGKKYGLAINDTIDERRDPVLACNAAADYLLESYGMYKDWLLAIASYNCGRNNIRWAMENNPGLTDYWSLRPYLPVETQNYVPAFIATVYIMNNSRKHGISYSDPEFNIFTKEISVNRPVTLQSIAKATNVNLSELCVLNAAYKNQRINGSAQSPKRLVMPVIKDYIHNALAEELHKPGKLERELKLTYAIPEEPKLIAVATTAVPSSPSKPTNVKYKAVNTYILYRVQSGDTLDSIVQKFNSTEEEVKILNKLKHYAVKPGMVLKIVQS